MAVDLNRVGDAQAIADKLADLPKEALLYIAGYAEGCRDGAGKKRKRKKIAEYKVGVQTGR